MNIMEQLKAWKDKKTTDGYYIEGVLKRGDRLLIQGAGYSHDCRFLEDAVLALTSGSDWLGLKVNGANVGYMTVQPDGGVVLDYLNKRRNQLFDEEQSHDLCICKMNRFMDIKELGEELIEYICDNGIEVLFFDGINWTSRETTDYGPPEYIAKKFCKMIDEVIEYTGIACIYTYYGEEPSEEEERALDYFDQYANIQMMIEPMHIKALDAGDKAWRIVFFTPFGSRIAPIYFEADELWYRGI